MPGDVVRIVADEAGWRLAQLPAVQAALVSLDMTDGAVRALVGGLDFEQSKFNRVAQALRRTWSQHQAFHLRGGHGKRLYPGDRDQ